MLYESRTDLSTMLLEVSSFIKESQLGSKSIKDIQLQTSGNLIQSYAHSGYHLPNYNAAVTTSINHENQIRGSFIQRFDAGVSLPPYLSGFSEDTDTDSLIVSPSDLHSGNCVIVSIIGTKIQTESFASIAIPLPDQKVQLAANSKSILSGRIPLPRTFTEHQASTFYNSNAYHIIPRKVVTQNCNIVGLYSNN